MELWNRSSYVKVISNLRTDSELKDKTVWKWEKFAVVARNWWKRWGKHTNWTLTTPNQQQDLNKNTNSTLRTLKLKYAKTIARKGCRTRKRNSTGLMVRTQEHSKLRVDMNLTVYLKLRLPLDENKGDQIFQKVLVSLDLVQTRHKSIRFPNNMIWNRATFLFFFDIFLLVRSTKGVTIENLSLNKWKTWPAEFSKDCENVKKTSRGENSNFGGKFWGSKIFKPTNGGDRQIQRNVSDRVWYMKRWNRSSYVKVMAILRTDYELDDKTVWKWEKSAASARNWRK